MSRPSLTMPTTISLVLLHFLYPFISTKHRQRELLLSRRARDAFLPERDKWYRKILLLKSKGQLDKKWFIPERKREQDEQCRHVFNWLWEGWSARKKALMSVCVRLCVCVCVVLYTLICLRRKGFSDKQTVTRTIEAGYSPIHPAPKLWKGSTCICPYFLAIRTFAHIVSLLVPVIHIALRKCAEGWVQEKHGGDRAWKRKRM